MEKAKTKTTAKTKNKHKNNNTKAVNNALHIPSLHQASPPLQQPLPHPLGSVRAICCYLHSSVWPIWLHRFHSFSCCCCWHLHLSRPPPQPNERTHCAHNRKQSETTHAHIHKHMYAHARTQIHYSTGRGNSTARYLQPLFFKANISSTTPLICLINFELVLYVYPTNS